METLRVTTALAVRSMKRTIRRPVFLVLSLLQPLIWLLLFSQVMKNFGRATLPPGMSYVTLFAPAVMLQTILFGSFQSGMGDGARHRGRVCSTSSSSHRSTAWRS